jgi:hypothetical protein
MTEVEPVEDEPIVESSFDISSLPTTVHNFVKRGAVVSCEGASHPSHRHFLYKR